ncbi:TauD/TfdA family dioxygenase [Temperatibacter marinus]|uniref:TauD/TfdA family dioxygenase n=1 Tax=Temperatibacter marinus TaxID=1456591 RepID=A0AA52EJK2_9PROT|nr:TauD/TfdA family dioxygenase [Temperatibacter marinus]WND03449.1 TauD/TfdA family dioxygenase [Temperatibacter marinus]
MKKQNTIPEITLSPKEVTALLSSRPPRSLLRTVMNALSTYPYCLKISGLIGHFTDEYKSEIFHLLKALKTIADPSSSAKVSMTRVEIKPEESRQKSSVTRYSRTDQKISMHTDSSYDMNPHNIMGFQCIVPDPSGGVSFLMPIDHLLDNLTEPEQALLREDLFPFREGTVLPILYDDEEGPSIRYYRSQLDIALSKENALQEKVGPLLDKIDGLLGQEDAHLQDAMGAGEMILINNHKVLHARSALSDKSNRLIYRGRISIHPTLSHLRLSWWPLKMIKKLWYAIRKSIPVDMSAVDKQIKKALRQDDLKTAAALIESYFDAFASDSSRPFHLAAIYGSLGEKEKAERAKKKACQRRPLVAETEMKKERISVMTIRGFKDGKYIYKKSAGRYSPSLMQGHFSLRNFLRSDEFNITKLNHYDQTDWASLATPDVDIFVNTVACAERMKEGLTALETFVENSGCRRIINPPRNVLETTRVKNYQSLGAIPGLVFPRTELFTVEGLSLLAVMKKIDEAALNYPIILRPSVTHTGKFVTLARTREDVESYFESHRYWGDYYAIEYRETVTDEGLYNKNRTFCIDGTFYPVAGLHHDQWNIHSGDRYSVMDKQKRLQEWEQNYLENFHEFLGEGLTALHAIRDQLKLDFFGVDFTKLPDGRLFIFEANASMRHNFDHAGNFPYTRPYLDKVSEAFDRMISQRVSSQ